LVIFMAGVAEERFKGFDVLHRACEGLWERRRDFRLLATGNGTGRMDEFTELVGWFSQEELPEQYRRADICVVPSVVQEGWPLVAVEAMAAGRPVVASRIGGLQFIVSSGATGLLVEPGDAEGLGHALEELMDDDELRRRLGREARVQFERHGSWEAIIRRHYVPLLSRATGRGQHAANAAGALRGG
jgi:glycosyltransferase involved in cell wall biosynthesis